LKEALFGLGLREVERAAVRVVGRTVPAGATQEVGPRGVEVSVMVEVEAVEPYKHLTTIDIEPAGDRTNVVMTVDPLHDETWTQQHCAHRGNELDNLEAAIRRLTR
jgi:hypothetical protein